MINLKKLQKTILKINPQLNKKHIQTVTINSSITTTKLNFDKTKTKTSFFLHENDFKDGKYLVYSHSYIFTIKGNPISYDIPIFLSLIILFKFTSVISFCKISFFLFFLYKTIDMQSFVYNKYQNIVKKISLLKDGKTIIVETIFHSYAVNISTIKLLGNEEKALLSKTFLVNLEEYFVLNVENFFFLIEFEGNFLRKDVVNCIINGESIDASMIRDDYHDDGGSGTGTGNISTNENGSSKGSKRKKVKRV